MIRICKSLSLAVILALVLSFGAVVLPLAGKVQAQSATNITCNSSEWWYTSLPDTVYTNSTPIQAAVDNSNTDNSIIWIEDGNYNENVDVNKDNLTIRSQNGTTLCVVNTQNSSAHVFEVTADNVTIQELTVKGATDADRAGIYLHGSHHSNIVGNDASNNYHGILLEESNDNVITGNMASNNKACGIRLYFSNGNMISGNTVSNCFNSIDLWESSDNMITGNRLSNSVASSLHVYSYSSNNTIYNNYFDNHHNASVGLDCIGSNAWSIDKTLGTNIVGGPYLGGNYWSDYAGEDTNGDGLGDTKLPYHKEISNAGDSYPLVEMSTPPSGTDLIASFTASPTQGIAPLTVNFNDQSSGTISSYEWSFGDGQGSMEQSPSYSYGEPGTYTATLTITGPGGTASTTCSIVVTSTVGEPDSAGGMGTTGIIVIVVIALAAIAGLVVLFRRRASKTS